MRRQWHSVDPRLRHLNGHGDCRVQLPLSRAALDQLPLMPILITIGLAVGAVNDVRKMRRLAS